MSFTTDFERTCVAFDELVRPVIEPWLGKDPRRQLLISHEGISCRSCNQLDHHCGIDYLHVDTARGVRGIASRIQWRRNTDSRWPYDTFTIRDGRDTGGRTEKSKLLFSVSDLPGAWIRPALHVQAYVSDDRLDSVAMVPTVQLVAALAGAEQNRTDNASFSIVSWTELKKRGAHIRVWRRSELMEGAA